MGAITPTEVSAAEIIHQNHATKLFTATTTGAGDTVDLSAYFENIHYVRSWDTGDGTDAEAYVTSADYTPAITLTQDKGAVYIEVRGQALKSTGGAT